MGARWHPSSAAARRRLVDRSLELEGQEPPRSVTITNRPWRRPIHSRHFTLPPMLLSSKAYIASLKHHQGSLNVLHTHFASTHNQVLKPEAYTIQTVFFHFNHTFLYPSLIYIYTLPRIQVHSPQHPLFPPPMYRCILNHSLFVLIVESHRSCLPRMFSRAPQLYIAS